MRVTSNADQLASTYRDFAAKLSAALQHGLQRILVAVEAAAQDNLSGSGAPFSYPVPVRTGNLRGSLGGGQVSPTAVEVFDNANYAWAVHEGVFNTWAGRGKHRLVQRVARPFMTDALESAQPTELMRDELQQVFA